MATTHVSDWVEASGPALTGPHNSRPWATGLRPPSSYCLLFWGKLTDENQLKHMWAVRHDGLIFGSGWYEQ